MRLTHDPLSVPTTDDARRAFSQLCTGLLVLTLVYQTVASVGIFAVIFAAALTQFLQNGFDPSALENISTAMDPVLLMVINDIGLYCVGVPLLWMIVKKLPAAGGGRRALTSRQVLRYGAATVACMYVFTSLGNFLNEAIELLGGSSLSATNSLAEMPLWAMFLFVCVIAPIGEELIFRKLLFDRALVYGEKAAILFTAIAFGLFHGNFEQFWYTLILGLLLGYLVLKTRDVRYAILMHFIANFFGGFVPMLVSEWEPLAGLCLLVILGIAVWGLIILAFNLRKIVLAPSPCLPDQGLLRAIWCHPTGIIFFCLCAVSALSMIGMMFLTALPVG